MTRAGDFDGNRRRGPAMGSEPDVRPADVFCELSSRPDGSPDLTRSIMGRLGYMRVSGNTASRRRHRGRLLRCMTIVAALGLVGLCIRIHEMGPGARHPDGPTIHSALRQDVSHTHSNLQRAFDTFRSLGPFVSPDRCAVDEQVDLQTDPAVEGQPDPLRSLWPDAWPELIDENVNQLAIAPVRWV